MRFEYPQTVLLNWARFFNGEEKEELKMLAKSDEFVQKAYDKLVDISADEEKRLEYEAREKAIRDYNNIISSGWVRGCEQGRKEGIQEGRRQGVRAAIEVCQELGMSKEDTVSKIMQKFSFSEEETKTYTEEYWSD